MSGLAPTHWRVFEKFLLFVGCKFVRERGDHRVYWRDDLKRPVILTKDTAVPVFILRNNLRLLGISPKEYLEILKNL